MREYSWDDVDESPEDVECDYCGFAPCACDDINDAHEVEQDQIEESR